jgi:molybdopterin converting factor small subunit
LTATGLANSLRRLRALAEAFAAGIRVKIDESAALLFGGRREPIVASDQSLRLKDMLAEASVFDREILSAAPANLSWRCEMARGWPKWLWRDSAVLVAIAAVDLGEIVRRAGDEQLAGQDWPELSAEALDEALGDLRSGPPRTFVAVCSGSGFSPEAMELAARRAATLRLAGGGLVLVRPRGDGGWVLRAFDEQASLPRMPEAEFTLGQPWHFVFDPEPVDGKIQRVRDAIAAGQVDLVERGLNDLEVSERLELPLALVDQVFAAEADRRSDLRIRRFEDRVVLLGQVALDSHNAEKNMTMFQKLRDLLGLAGQEKRKIELLADKRALLNARRDRLYREMDELGEREQTLLQRGIGTDSKVMQRRLASELSQVRRRLEQGNTLVGVVNRQIDALSTHIHHLTLLTQGDEVALPSIEEMTRDAVRAEELIERIRSDADVVESLTDVTTTSLDSMSEEKILAEFAAGRQEKGERGGTKEAGNTQRTSFERSEPGRPTPERPQRDRMKE